MGKPEGRSGWEPVRPLSSQRHICPQTTPLSHHPAPHDPDLIHGLILRGEIQWVIISLSFLREKFTTAPFLVESK